MGKDSFSFRQFTVYQQLCAMKVGTDGTLLGAWARPGGEPGSVSILDVGTGTGLIALMMAQRYPQARVWAIDVDEAAVEQARLNVAASPFCDRICVGQMALQQLSAPISDRQYDGIVCNPPYFENSLLCPDSQRTTARHALTLTLGELADISARLLTREGELSVVLPADMKTKMDGAAALAGLFPHRCCLFHTTPRKAPNRVLLAYGRQPATAVEQQVMVMNDEEYRKLTAAFYLHSSLTPDCRK